MPGPHCLELTQVLLQSTVLCSVDTLLGTLENPSLDFLVVLKKGKQVQFLSVESEEIKTPRGVAKQNTKQGKQRIKERKAGKKECSRSSKICECIL